LDIALPITRVRYFFPLAILDPHASIRLVLYGESAFRLLLAKFFDFTLKRKKEWIKNDLLHLQSWS